MVLRGKLRNTIFYVVITRIYTAYSSYVLQPLDVGAFSALKRVYRKHLGNLVALTNANPVGKLNFLRCYKEARDEALIDQNIKGGFRGTRIWPRNKVKARASRQVIALRAITSKLVVNPITTQIQTPASRKDTLTL